MSRARKTSVSLTQPVEELIEARGGAFSDALRIMVVCYDRAAKEGMRSLIDRGQRDYFRRYQWALAQAWERVDLTRARTDAWEELMKALERSDYISTQVFDRAADLRYIELLALYDETLQRRDEDAAAAS